MLTSSMRGEATNNPGSFTTAKWEAPHANSTIFNSGSGTDEGAVRHSGWQFVGVSVKTVDSADGRANSGSVVFHINGVTRTGIRISDCGEFLQRQAFQMDGYNSHIGNNYNDGKSFFGKIVMSVYLTNFRRY